MGMFDTLLVKKELIAPLVEQDFFEALERDVDNGFFNFQTKDLDNGLNVFKIEEDLKLKIEKRSYSLDLEEDDSFKKIKSESLGYSEDTRTAYVSFYDYLGHVGEYDVFITFCAHILKGEVQEIKVEKIEKEKLSIVKARGEYVQQRYKNIRATQEWKLWNFLNDAEWKIRRFFLPLTRKYSNFKQKLKNAAEAKYPDEMPDSWRYPSKD